MNPYDQLEYKSFPFAQSTPAYIFAIAKCFGHPAPGFETARVLEMGCASGGNLIPIAYQFPKANFIGIDYSEKQIEKGKQLIEQIGLDNIRLEHTDLQELDLNQEKFDYIIAHGLFSWVSQGLQKQIFHICQKLLKPEGLAYISYNTYPGWNQMKTIRDMMIYHTRHQKDPIEKLNSSRAIFNIVQEGTSHARNAYSEFLRQEANSIKNIEDYYLYHEHLEQENHPVYFYEFMEVANQYGLSYLGDAVLKVSLQEQQIQGMSKKHAEQITDPIEKEQFLDFLTNRRFRSSILIKSKEQKKSAFKPEHLDNPCLASTLKSVDKLKSAQLLDQSSVVFSTKNLDLKTRHPVSKCLLHVLQQQNKKPVVLNELVEKVSLLTGQPSVKIRNYFFNSFNLLPLLSSGALTIHSLPPDSISTVSQMPKASKVARVQSGYGNEVTNLHHTSVRLNDFDSELLKLLDGKKSKDQLLEHLLEKTLKSRPSKNVSVLKANLLQQMQQSLEKFSQHGLLEA